MTTQQNRTPQPEIELRQPLPKPAYRDLFLAPDLPERQNDEDELPLPYGR